MSAKIGRPLSSNPKQNDIKVRIDNKTHEKLLKYCNAKGVTKAEAVRGAIVEMLEKEK